MDALCEQLLACAGLAVNQKVGIRIAESFGNADGLLRQTVPIQDALKRVFCHKALFVKILADFSFILLNLGDILKGYDAAGVSALSSYRDAVHHERQLVKPVDFGKNLFPFLYHFIDRNTREII